jgi:hypothetical protein
MENLNNEIPKWIVCIVIGQAIPEAKKSSRHLAPSPQPWMWNFREPMWRLWFYQTVIFN